jgi:hypothetical protein
MASPFDQLVGIIHSKNLDAWKDRNAQEFQADEINPH